MNGLCRGIVFWTVLAAAFSGRAAPGQTPPCGAQQAAQAAASDATIKALARQYALVSKNIASHPCTDDEAARKLFDVLMLAYVVGDAATGDEIRARLILEYPSTVEARYLVVQFPNETAYRQTLLQAWNGEPRELTAEFLRKFHGAVRLGADRWKAALFSDDSFTIVAALSALQAGDAEFLAMLTPARSQANIQSVKEPSATATIALLDLAPREKYLRLVPHCGQVGAADFCDYLYAQVPAEDRLAAEVAAGRARQLMAAHRYQDALPVLTGLLAGEPAPLHLLWQAWALALTRQPEEAVRVLDAIDALSAPHEFADECQQLRAAVGTLPAIASVHRKAIRRALASMAPKGELQLMEAQVKFGDRLENDAYLGIDFGQKTLGLQLVKSGRSAFACRLEQGASKFFFRDETRLIAFRALDAFPMTNLTLGRAPNGSLTFNYNFNMVSASQEAVSPLQSMIQSPFLADEKGLQESLDHWVLQGWLPLPAEELAEGGARRFRWISLDASLLGHQSHEFHLSPKNRLVLVKSPTLEVAAIRYGQSGSFKLKLPTLPDLPVESREKFDAVSAIQMLGWAATLFQDDASQVATRPE